MKENKPILERLRRRGVSLDNLVASALELYEPDERVDADKEKGEIERRLRRLIQSRCEDVNVHLLIRAALYLDDELAEGRVEVEGDPVNLLCDEFLGMSIAEYIGGKSALFNYVRYDMRKPGVLSELGVFLDDVIAGLIAGCMTRLFEDW